MWVVCELLLQFVQKLLYGQSFLQCVYSPHVVHWMAEWSVPRFLDEKSFLGMVPGPVNVPGVGLLGPVSVVVFFLPLLPLDPLSSCSCVF